MTELGKAVLKHPSDASGYPLVLDVSAGNGKTWKHGARLRREKGKN